MKSLFAANINKENYRLHFAQTDLWLPAITAIQQKHRLSGKPIRATLGSHIVFRVAGFWIKLIAPFYNDMQFEIEGLKSVPQNFAYQYPIIIAHDHLEDWEYLILSNVEGEPIRNIWPSLSLENKRELALQIGKMIAALNQFSISEKILQRFSWNQFILERFYQLSRGEALKPMPPAWLTNLPSFVSQFSVDEFLTSAPVFLHADLTSDHFLVSPGNVKLKGLIDFADCQAGHSEYELAAPAVFIFKSQKELLQIFLIASGISPNRVNQKFSEKLLMWCLLHRYFNFAKGFAKEVEQTTPGNFSELAKRVFPLEE